MQIETAPFSVGAVSINPADLVVPAVVLIVGVILMFSLKREVATFAIAACVIGALLTV